MSAPLYANHDPVTRRSTEIEIDRETGHLVFVHSQNTKAIVESAKRLASNFDPHTHGRADMVHVARIPMVIWQQLQRLGITRDEKAFNAWLDSREARLLRTDDGRKL